MRMKFVLIKLKLLTIANSFITLLTIANSVLPNITEHENLSAKKYENANSMFSWAEHEQSVITSRPVLSFVLSNIYLCLFWRAPTQT